MFSGTRGKAAALLKPLALAGSLAAAFAGANGAEAAPRHHSPHHRPALTRHFQKAVRPGEHILYYYVRSHHFELDGHIYDGGSGQKQGYNNSAYECRKNIGPVPRGSFSLTPREAPYFGQPAWRVNGTPCNRTGILVHSDRIGVRDRPQGETKGCAAVKDAEWKDFVKEMNAYRPTRIIVKP
jgi:hypothetical protein